MRNFHARRPNPVSKDKRNKIRNKKKMNFAMPAAATANPANPNTAAIKATIKNISAQFNMVVAFTETGREHVSKVSPL
jgi:hypothetical protein